MAIVLNKLNEYKKKYPFTVIWRLPAHAKVIEANLHDNEEVLYAFGGQKDNNHFGFFNTFVVVLTSERLVVAQKHLLVGYSVNSITPDLFNDLQIISGLLWGSVTIDTVKEVIYLSYVSKKSLPEIQKTVTKFMIEEKKKYVVNHQD